MSDKFRTTRKELLEQVWSIPLIHLAPKYGLSDVGMRKRCKALNIPLPPKGYWQRKEYEWKSPPPLPPYDGREEIEFRVKENPLKDYPVDLEQLKLAEEQLVFEQLEENKITVVSNLRSSHPLIKQYRENKIEGLSQPSINSLNPTPNDKSLDITVTKESLRRALCIMNTLIKELEKRRFSVSIEENKSAYGSSQNTFVEIFGEKLRFGLKEPYRQIKRQRSAKERQKWSWLSEFEYELVPSGKLVLEIREWDPERKNWSDTKNKKLEERLNEFIAGLVKAAVVMRCHRLKREEERKIREAETKRRAELRRQREKEQEKFDQLLQNAKAWDQCQKIRSFIEAVRGKALRTPKTLDPDNTTGKWIAWAEQQADRLDPLIDSPPSILDDEEDDFNWRYGDFD